MIVLPNKLVELNGVDVSVLGCVVVVLPNKNPLPVRFWFIGVDCPNRLVLLGVVKGRLNMMISNFPKQYL